MPKKVARKKAARPAKKKGPIKASTAIAVRKSSIHGKGVFARRAIRKGARLTEYWGPAITWEEAERRYPKDPVPYHTFLFEIGDGSMCIDAHKSCRRLLWLNPLLRYDGFEARPAGIRAMLPHVDDFMPAHNMSSLIELAKTLNQAGARRGLGKRA